MSCLNPSRGNMISWTGASRECQNEGGHLWSINSHEQWRELHMLMNVHALNNTIFANLYFQLFQTELTFIGFKDDEVISNAFTSIYANYLQYVSVYCQLSCEFEASTIYFLQRIKNNKE